MALMAVGQTGAKPWARRVVGLRAFDFEEDSGVRALDSGFRVLDSFVAPGFGV